MSIINTRYSDTFETGIPRSEVGNKPTETRYEIFGITINMTSKKNSFLIAM